MHKTPKEACAGLTTYLECMELLEFMDVYGFTDILSIVQQNMFPHDVLELKKRVESKRRADDVTD